MISFFRKEVIKETATPKGMHKVLLAEDLLAPYKKQLKHIRRLSAASNKGFDKYYLPVINQFVESVQLIPGPKSGGFETIGGMIDKSLLLAIESLKARQGYLLPVGSTAEEIARTKELWTYVTFVGALVHRMGHGLYEFEMVFFDKKGNLKEGRYWPLITPVEKEFYFYKLRKLENINSKSERYLPILLLRSLLGEESFNWILTNDKALEELLSYMVGGSLDDKNALSQIIRTAYSYLQNKGLETPELEGIESVEQNADEQEADERISVDDEVGVEINNADVSSALDSTEQLNARVLDEKVKVATSEPEQAKEATQQVNEAKPVQDDLPKVEQPKKTQSNKKKQPISQQPKTDKPILTKIIPEPPKDDDWLSGPPQEFLNKLVADIKNNAIAKDMVFMTNDILNIQYPLGLKLYTQTPADMKTKLKATIFWVGEDKGGLERKKRYIQLRLKNKAR